MPRSVLVIEDSEVDRDALSELLSEAGYQVSCAADGDLGLRALRSGGQPDVILLDLVMPGMNGWEFRAQQRKDPLIAGIPVIAVTADRTAMATAMDSAAVVSKPFSARELFSAIEEVLRARDAERLEQTEKMAALGRLAASVAHEVNNPLAFAKSNLSIVQRDLLPALRRGEPLAPDDAADLEQLLADSVEGLQRIERIVKDILLFGRTSVGTTARTDIEQQLRLALKVCSGRLRGVAVIETFLPVPPVMADPTRLGQVFLNLVINAADAMALQPGPSRRLSLATRLQSGWVETSVEDSGPGIPDSVLPRIFEPFFTTKPPGLGTGLGLFVCRGLIESMGGRIEVVSRLGQGSRFRVLLPAARADA